MSSEKILKNLNVLETNFREKFQQLNRVNLTDAEFDRLLEDVISADTYTAAQALRATETFMRDDGTPLNYTLVNKHQGLVQKQPPSLRRYAFAEQSSGSSVRHLAEVLWR